MISISPLYGRTPAATSQVRYACYCLALIFTEVTSPVISQITLFMFLRNFLLLFFFFFSFLFSPFNGRRSAKYIAFSFSFFALFTLYTSCFEAVDFFFFFFFFFFLQPAKISPLDPFIVFFFSRPFFPLFLYFEGKFVYSSCSYASLSHAPPIHPFSFCHNNHERSLTNS